MEYQDIPRGHYGPVRKARRKGKSGSKLVESEAQKRKRLLGEISGILGKPYSGKSQFMQPRFAAKQVLADPYDWPQ